ncbi:hypothetical protein MKX07_007271 [Trichoderma sp. CBMAI-0711]|uniref:Predicted protein n=3 Tax=Trichoderma TaxID=5543 RepID=G0RUA3_HYPJQ|nr:uncharacterized protein TRIREDRAFT_68876 [Trichoderma reesei QM6a]ETR98389.1 hypothetical protein M419DRAFT_89220 [Trichoderma reesei RUT C-30]KAH0492815.1 hypothetical protein TgHK011_007746 [Trichoderma gracile]KAK1251792.1 hypothetical protein MKX07_007271 [Trichoderma sp. CBMAI-0711]OTA01651.1 hypothetical protein A9Z42_0019690 [Trichoderma parareesei]EGR45151.1 predicted protein [Trichoderma reesei QM6a]
MSPLWYALRLIQAFEDRIIESILRQPGFHRAVGRIHRAIHEKQHGRNPHEPLAPGEATADPNPSSRADGFFKHFLSELKNQARGKPSDISDKPPTK